MQPSVLRDQLNHVRAPDTRVELWVGSPIPPDPSGFLQTPASNLQRPEQALRSLLGDELEMRFGGNPIEGSNPSLSAITSPDAREKSGAMSCVEPDA